MHDARNACRHLFSVAYPVTRLSSSRGSFPNAGTEMTRRTSGFPTILSAARVDISVSQIMEPSSHLPDDWLHALRPSPPANNSNRQIDHRNRRRQKSSAWVDYSNPWAAVHAQTRVAPRCGGQFPRVFAQIGLNTSSQSYPNDHFRRAANEPPRSSRMNTSTNPFQNASSRLDRSSARDSRDHDPA